MSEEGHPYDYCDCHNEKEPKMPENKYLEMAKKIASGMEKQTYSQLSDEIATALESVAREKDAEIARLKMLVDFPESSFKWRWAKAQEEIAELKDVLLQYELCCDKGTDYLAKKLSESQRKLERAVKFLKRFVDRCPHKLTHPCGLCDDEARDFLEELTSEGTNAGN